MMTLAAAAAFFRQTAAIAVITGYRDDGFFTLTAYPYGAVDSLTAKLTPTGKQQIRCGHTNALRFRVIADDLQTGRFREFSIANLD